MSTRGNVLTIPTASEFKGTNIEAVNTQIVAAISQVDGQYLRQVITGDGAITGKEGVVVFTKGSAGAITIEAPTATTDDGKEITCIAGSAQAHVITSGTVGFNAKGSSGTATFGGAIGDAVKLMAYQGNWYTASNVNVTIA